MDTTFKQCNSANYRKGRTGTIKYIVIHYTANDGDTAEDNANYFAKNKTAASAHFFVDEKEVYQSVAESDTAWHCGTKGKYLHAYCRNENSLGVELCSRKNEAGKYYFKDDTVSNAAKLVKELMAKYSIPISGIIRHYDVTGKKCPAPFVEDENAWEAFKKNLTLKEDIEAGKGKGNTPSLWAKSSVEKAITKEILQGDEEGNLLLQDAVTREQLMVFFDRLGLLD